MADDSDDLNQTLSEAQQALRLNTGNLDDPRINKNQGLQPPAPQSGDQKPSQAPAIQPAQDPTTPGAGATTHPEPIAQTGGQDPGNQPKPATQQDIMQHTYELQKRAEASREASIKYYQSMQDQITKLSETPYPEAPALKDYPQMPDVQQERRQGAKASLAFMMIAIPLAVAFGGKGPAMWGAMNGIGKGLQSIKEGNEEQIQQNYNLWRSSYEMIHQENVERSNNYKELLSSRNNTIKEKMEAIKSLATSYHDIATERAAEAGDWEKFMEQMEKNEKVLNDSRKKVLGQTNQITKLFQSKDGELYRSAMAEKYPDLAGGLYSNDPNKQSIAWEELLKRGQTYWKWYKDNRRYLGTGETQQEKDEDLMQHPPKTVAKPGSPGSDQGKLQEFLKNFDLGGGSGKGKAPEEPEEEAAPRQKMPMNWGGSEPDFD
jgi:hypothetical protein